MQYDSCHVWKLELNSLKDATHDIVLTDPAFGGGVLLAHRLGLPLVFNVRWTMYGEGHFVVAPSPLSYILVTGLHLTDKMTFSQRVMNMLTYIMIRYKSSKYYGSPYQEFSQKYFGPNVNFFSLLQNAVPLREHRAVSRRYGERHQRCPALNHMCNQSKLTGDVMNRMLKSTWCAASASFLSFSKALCVCQSIVFCESVTIKIGNKKVYS